MKYTLGYIFHKDGTMSPRDYISYSAHSLWKKDKEEYRRRYYEGQDGHVNSEMIFGKTIAEQLENGVKIKGLKLYDKSEEPLNVKLGDINLKGYVDSFDTKKIRFIEIKTGHLDSKGNVPWNDLKVHKHSQLVWYYMMLQMKYGKCNPLCHLIWLETRFKNKSLEYQGHILETQSRELELTGRVETFKRKIEEWEVDKLKKDIQETTLQIHNDFIQWKNNK